MDRTHWLRATLIVIAGLALAQLGEGLLWLLLASAGIAALVWRACGAFVRHLLGR